MLLSGVVERRLLVNYRVDPEVVQRLLPKPLRPRLVNGHAVAGICLLRLGGIHPRVVPTTRGFRSENAAHRIAVEWGDDQQGVYIGRRDTGSRLNALAGGRVFPGEHHLAAFRVTETPSDIHVEYDSDETHVDVYARVTDQWTSKLFPTIEDASAFFRAGCDGYSETRSGTYLDGMRLSTDNWTVEAAKILAAGSTVIEDLPRGSAELDCALLMRNVQVNWLPLPPMPVRGLALAR